MVKGIQEGGEGVVEEDQVVQWLLLMQERRWLLSHPEGKLNYPEGKLNYFQFSIIYAHGTAYSKEEDDLYFINIYDNIKGTEGPLTK